MMQRDMRGGAPEGIPSLSTVILWESGPVEACPHQQVLEELNSLAVPLGRWMSSRTGASLPLGGWLDSTSSASFT